MAVNSRVLLDGLIQYQDSLERHLLGLQEEYHDLEELWLRFSAVYEGDAADQFKAGWSRTEARFREYIDRTKTISLVLDERIGFLREANKQEEMQLG